MLTYVCTYIVMSRCKVLATQWLAIYADTKQFKLIVNVGTCNAIILIITVHDLTGCDRLFAWLLAKC